MDNNQDDVYAARRAELEAQFQALPPTGSGDYWRRIEEPDAERRLPLEVLAHCCRERNATGSFAMRIASFQSLWSGYSYT